MQLAITENFAQCMGEFSAVFVILEGLLIYLVFAISQQMAIVAIIKNLPHIIHTNS